MFQNAHFAMRPIDADRTDILNEDLFAHQANSTLANLDLGLFETKWFDYRFMSPFRATMHFAEAYDKVWHVIFARERDRTKAGFINLRFNPAKLVAVFKKGSIKENLSKDDLKELEAAKRYLSSVWRARQVADAIGCPYEFYVEWAMTYRLRNWKQRSLPLPSHLYHEWDVEKVIARWNEEQSSRMFLSEHPAYMVENYTALPCQTAYHDWLVKQAHLRRDIPYVLSEFVREGRLTVDRAREGLGRLNLSRFNELLESPRAFGL